MSILSSQSILEAIKSGDIEIDPFNPDNLNPASYDLTLDDRVVMYSSNGSIIDTSIELDSAQNNKIEKFKISEDGIWIHPGQGYLMATRERITTKKYVPVLDGKSSIGRLFVWIHLTAGYGDPYFDGQYTLEVSSIYPTKLYAGMRICQMRFHELKGEVGVDYQKSGHYNGEFADGPVPSRSWMMFKK